MARQLQYLGVLSPTPPNAKIRTRAPRVTDIDGVRVMDLWLEKDTELIWMLTSKADNIATWTSITGGGAGTITTVNGGTNITTVNSGGPIVTINLDDSLHLPVTNVAGDEGVYFLGANTFLHNRGTQNTFVGQSSGNLALVEGNARRNTGCGYQTLQHNLDGEQNVALGDSALATLVDGDRNVAIGHGSLDQATDLDFNTAVGGDTLTQLLTGDYNTVLGYEAGIFYVGAESSNILINNTGVIGDGNTIRIGDQGVGVGQQNSCYIAGSYQAAVGGINEVMLIDSTGKLGSSKGDNGEILIGATNGPPLWRQLTSSDGSVIINSGVNSISLTVGGAPGGGSTTFNTDVNSPAVVLGNVINILGDGVLETDGSVANTVTVGIPGNVHGDILLTDGAGNTVWGNITSTGGSITRTYPAGAPANTINLEAVGAGGGANTFTTDDGDGVAVGGVINVLGGLNVGTAGAGQTVTVNLDTSITLPDTNAAGTEGLYSLASGTTFMHNFGAAGTSFNTFLGQDAGNLVLTTSVDSTGIGYESLNSLTTGISNTCVGSGSGKDLTTGSYNTTLGDEAMFQGNSSSHNVAIGRQALHGHVTGEYNIALGSGAGSNCTGADSSNILIGHAGSAALNNTIYIGTHGGGQGQQNRAFMAGVYNITPAGGTHHVIIDAAGQLGSSDVVGDVTGVNGGTNITTVNGGGPVVTVNLDPNVVLAGNLTAVNGHFTGALTFGGIGGRGIVQSSAAGVLSSSEGASGQILIGSNAAAPRWEYITAGTGIDVDPGAHSIEISATGALDIDSFGGSHTLVLGNQGNEVIISSGGAVNLTIPHNGAVAFPIGTQIIVVQGGAGTLTVVPGGGVTLHSAGGRRELFEQYSSAALIKQAADVWLLVGDIK